MSDFEVTDDLGRKFAAVDSIGGYSEELREEAARVAAANLAAGGTDEYGRIYHAQVDPATSQMNDLLHGFGTVFTTLSGSGVDAVRGFHNADQAATDEAKRW